MAGVNARVGFIGIVCVVVVYLLLSNNTGPSHPSHSPSHPKGSEVFERRIVALGDLHGHLPNALTVLKMSGVINEEQKWTGDVDFLVQTGDIIDR